MEEIKALKYAQMEILDMHTYDQTVRNIQTENGVRMSKTSEGRSDLHKEVILPFLVGVKCFGFYIYGTPLIYTQEMTS